MTADPIIGLLGILVLLVLIMLGVHVSVALGLVGVVGITLIGGPIASLGLLKQTPFYATAVYTYAVIPLFIMVGMFAFYAGLGEVLFKFANAWFGWIPGGLAISTIIGATGFAAISGSTIASAAVFTKLCLPEMMKAGYSKKLASGAITISGTLSSLIPPSAVIVIYGIITEQSIGRLLMAGVIPGVMLAAIYMVIILVWSMKVPTATPKTTSITWKARWGTLSGLWAPLLVVLAISGGIFTGRFNPTEAGAVGIALITTVGLILRKLKYKEITASMLDTAKATAMVFALIIGAMLFGRFLILSGLTGSLVSFISEWQAPRHLVFIAILAIFVVLGCFMEAMSMLVVVLPIIFPVVAKLGYDPIWFGVIAVIVYQIAVITPPVGLAVYTVKAASGDVLSLNDVFQGSLVFLLGTCLGTAIIMAFPGLVLFLPNLMR